MFSSPLTSEKEAQLTSEMKLKEPETSDFWYVPDSEFLKFTKAISSKLPREIRDDIYTYLLDEETIQNIGLCAQHQLGRYPFPKPNVPKPSRFLNHEFTEESITQEIVEAFYGAYQGFCVLRPIYIDKFLNEDFFQVGVAPKNVVLSALQVKGRVEDNIFNQNTPARWFAPLLNEKQCLDKNFKLSIYFQTKVTMYDDEFKLEKLSEKLSEIFGGLKPVFEAFQNELPMGTIEVAIQFGDEIQTWYPSNNPMLVETKCTGFSKWVWLDEIKFCVRNMMEEEIIMSSIMSEESDSSGADLYEPISR